MNDLLYIYIYIIFYLFIYRFNSVFLNRPICIYSLCCAVLTKMVIIPELICVLDTFGWIILMLIVYLLCLLLFSPFIFAFVSGGHRQLHYRLPSTRVTEPTGRKVYTYVHFYIYTHLDFLSL